MPACRNCHTRLNKFDKDICPICGCKNPFLGVSSDTNEITQEIKAVSEINNTYRPKKRKSAVISSLFVGFLGIPFYYLGYYLSGILYALMNLLLASSLFVIFYLTNFLNWYYSLFIAIGFLFFCNIILAFVFGVKNNIKDSHRELLK